MKILLVTTRVPYPPHKGDKLKIYNILKHLAKNNKVKVLCLSQSRAESESIGSIRELGVEIEVVGHSTFRYLAGACMGVFSGRPIQASLYHSRKLAARVAAVSETEKPDAIYFHFIRSAQYLEHAKGSDAVKVLDFTDAVSLYLTRFVEATRNPVLRWLIANERNRVARYEKIAEQFDACFICSPLDRDYLMGRGIKAEFQILPNGVDTDIFTRSGERADAKRIIFTGNMPYFPNEDAVVHFAKKIFPKILEAVPEARLYVVGRKPTRKVRRLRSEHVIITGFVENIVSEYLKSAVAIAPTRFGAGTLNKVIEPVVLGVPVVATSIAARGLPLDVQEYVSIADSPEEFGRAVIAVLNGEQRRASQSELEGIRRRLSWDHIVGVFEDSLRAKVEAAAGHDPDRGN